MTLHRLEGILLPSKALDTRTPSENAGAAITIVGEDPTCPWQETIGAADASITHGREAMVEQIDVEVGVGGNATLRGWLFVPDAPDPGSSHSISSRPGGRARSSPGHWSHVEQPAVVASILTRFLTALSHARRGQCRTPITSKG